FLDTVGSDAVGVARYGLPAVLGWIGFVLLRDRRDPHAAARAVVGLSVALVAWAGFAHLAGGPAQWSGHLGALRRHGGYAGAAVGGGLRDLLAAGGAVAVLLAASVLAMLVVTSTSLRTAANGVAEAARWLGRGAASAAARLTAPPSAR